MSWFDKYNEENPPEKSDDEKFSEEMREKILKWGENPKVLVDKAGNLLTHEEFMESGLMDKVGEPVVIFVRNDGWAIYIPKSLIDYATGMSNEWVGFIRRPEHFVERWENWKSPMGK